MPGGLSKNVKLITIGLVLTSMGFAATAPFMAIYLAKARSILFYIVTISLIEALLFIFHQRAYSDVRSD